MYARPHVYMYINSNNSNVNVMFQVISYPDNVIKRYSNNGRIVNADDEYVSTGG